MIAPYRIPVSGQPVLRQPRQFNSAFSPEYETL